MTTIRTKAIRKNQGEDNQEAQVGVVVQGGTRIKRATATATVGNTEEVQEAAQESMFIAHNK
jgi:hypothetical protein